MAFQDTIDLLTADENNRWAIGASINRGLANGYTWRDLDAALTSAGLDYQASTLRAYARVTKAFPVQDRVDGVSFAAHQAALTAGSATEGRKAIESARATGGKATRDSVLAEVRKMKGRTGAQTSDAVAAWRDLRRGVEKILELSASELTALLTLDGGKYAGQASTLSRDLGAVSVKVSEALTKAEKQAQAKSARTAARVSKSATPKATPTVTRSRGQATKATAAPVNEGKAPKLGRLGSSRGQVK